MRPGRGMRRSNNRGGGGGASRGHGGGSRNMDTGRLPSLVDMDRPSPLLRDSAAPLVSNHLQDLDMELALLKLKREIIEQQHQMLSGASSSSDRFSSGGRQSQYNYDPPQQSYSQQQRYKEPASKGYAQYYEDRSGGGARAAKRAASWRDSAPTPKRYQADTPRGRQPPQLKPSPWAAKPKERRDPPSSKAPKPARAEGKQLVAMAANMEARPDMVLREGKIPTRQMSGRLELALGSVLKEMREAFPAEMSALNGVAMRAVKQTIRERVHAVMVGRTVGPGPDIVKHYRDKHPASTDIDVIKIGQAADRNTPTHKLAMTILEADDPEVFFKQNFNRLMNIKLDEMFGKLQEMYKETDTSKTVNNMLDVFVNEEGWILEPLLKNEENKSEEVKDNKADDKTDEKSQTKEASKDKFIVLDTVGETSDGNDAKTTESTDKNDTQSDDKAENDSQNEEKTTNDSENVEKTTNDSQSEEKTDADVDASQNESQNDSKAEEKMDVDASSDDKNKPDVSDKNVSDSAKGNVDGYPYRKKFKAAFYSKVMEGLMRKRLPYLLPKFKQHIIKILNLDQEYKNTIAYLMVKTKKRELEAKAAGKDFSKTTPNKGKPPLLFVKIVGKPCLPKRNKMQTFLDKFHPASIKKHRGVHNLLFVGFNTKEDFDGIMASSKTVVDNCVLDIKESQRTKNIANTSNNSANDSTTQNKSDVKLDTDLDNQISDLLDSIRDDEEGKLKETEDNLTEALKDDEIQILAEKEANVIEVEDDTPGDEKEATDNPAEAKEANDKPDNDTIILDDDNEDNEDDADGKTNGDKVSEENEEKDATEEEAKNENVEAVKNAEKESGGGTTPARASARIATSTPSTVRTRRASRIAQK